VPESRYASPDLLDLWSAAGRHRKPASQLLDLHRRPNREAPMTSVLLVEDDDMIGQALQTGLASQDYQVWWARTGNAALARVESAGADLILLDLGLPDLDGVEVCRQLRASQPHAVIVILTARDEEIDVILGLEAGADDYLVKPVRLTELLARLRAHLRRSQASWNSDQVLCVGSLRVDLDSRRAWVAERELALRAKEFDLLARLAADAGQVVSRESLMADVWDENWFGSTKTLDVHVASLRRKLGTDGTLALVTLRGRGYRLQAQPD
jgi:DNA-binding response OmpR family regulator